MKIGFIGTRAIAEAMVQGFVSVAGEVLMDEAATTGGSNDQVLTLLKERCWFEELNDSLETVLA